MEKFKRVLVVIGFILMPLAFMIWMADRVLMVLMPKLDHKGFSEWLRTEEITIATVRLIIIFIAKLVIGWLFFA